jgi:hypothetical protein
VGRGGGGYYQANCLLRHFVTWRFPRPKQCLLAKNVRYRFVNSHHVASFVMGKTQKKTLWMWGNQWPYTFQGTGIKFCDFSTYPSGSQWFLGTCKPSGIQNYSAAKGCIHITYTRTTDMYIYSATKGCIHITYTRTADMYIYSATKGCIHITYTRTADMYIYCHVRSENIRQTKSPVFLSSRLLFSEVWRNASSRCVTKFRMKLLTPLSRYINKPPIWQVCVLISVNS